MKMIFRFFFSVAFFAGYFHVHAQTRILSRPLVYEKTPCGNLEQNHLKKTGSRLTVICDRNNVPVYENPDGGSPKAKLKFRDYFYVIDEKGEYFKLAKGDGGAQVDGDKIYDPTIVGWVKKEHLLLWTHALVNCTNKFTRKALPIVREPSVLSNPEKYIGKDDYSILCFESPQDIGQSDGVKEQLGLFNIFYIYKEIESPNSSTKKAFLIGKTDRFNPSLSRNNILGWVSDEVMFDWNSRLCIQPNFDPEAIEERRKMNKKATLFFTPQDAASFSLKNNSSGKPNYEVLDKFEKDGQFKVWEPSTYRLPVFENKASSDDYITVGHRTPIVSSEGTIPDFQREIIDKIVINRRQINIAVVYDGAEAGISKDRIKTFVDAVFKKYADLSLQTTYPNLRIALVAYGASSEQIKSVNFSSDPETIKDKLYELPVYQTTLKSRKVRLGLYTALKLFDSNGAQKNSNFIVMLGGASDEDVSQAAEIKRLYAKHSVNLTAYQIVNQTSDEYAEFPGMLKRLCDNGNLDIFNNLSQEENPATGQKYSFQKYAWERIDLTGNSQLKAFKIKYDGNLVLRADIYFPPSGSQVAEYDFSSFSLNYLDDISRFVQKIVDDLDVVVQKKTVSPALLNVLKSQGITDAELDNILKVFQNSNYQFFAEGYVPASDEYSEYYERVLFYTKEELESFRKSLDNLVNSVDLANESQTRTAIYDFVIEILAGYYGPNEAKEQMEKMSMSNIMGLLGNVKPKKGSLLDQLRPLSEIKSKNGVPWDKIQKAVTLIINKRKDIVKVLNGSDYRWEADTDAIYYWVPERFIP